MSSKKKSTAITSAPRKRSKRSKRSTARVRSQKARILSLDEQGPKFVFDSSVSVGRSAGEMAAEIADPLARAIEELAPRAGVDVILVSDNGEKNVYVVEAKRPAKRGKAHAGKRVSKKTSSGAKGKEVRLLSSKGAGKSVLLSYEVAPRALSKAVRATTEELAERMLPEAPVPSPAQATLAQRESQARWSMLEEFGAFTSEELADQRSQAKNRHALANRWRSEGKVFAVELRGRRLYPGFQFDPETFAPEPIVADVLAALPRNQMSDWEVALWWVASDPWLNGRRPVDLLEEDPEAVTSAAAGLAEPSPL